jgi:hypothetical protein
MTFSSPSQGMTPERTLSGWVTRPAATPPDFSEIEVSEGEHIYLSAFGGLKEEREGSSLHRPLFICATAANIGVPMEYAYLEEEFGVMGKDWTVDLRSLATNFHGRTVETFRLALADGTKVDFHFDVTSFFRS